MYKTGQPVRGSQGVNRESYPVPPPHDHDDCTAKVLCPTGLPWCPQLLGSSTGLLPSFSSLAPSSASFSVSNSLNIFSTRGPDSISFLAHFFPFVSGVYTLNSDKQWKNKVTGQKLPECEAGRKPRALGSRSGMGVEGPVLRWESPSVTSWWECPSVTSLLWLLRSI